MISNSNKGLITLLRNLRCEELRDIASTLEIARSASKASLISSIARTLKNSEASILLFLSAKSLKRVIGGMKHECEHGMYELTTSKLTSEEIRNLAQKIFFQGRAPSPACERWYGAGVLWAVEEDCNDCMDDEIENDDLDSSSLLDSSREGNIPSDKFREIVEIEPEKNIKYRIFKLPQDALEPPPLYIHQQKCLDALMASKVSGIVFLPTGAGKTRIAIEFIARQLHLNPKQKFIWISYPIELIRQAMLRTVELSRLFPKGSCVTWGDADFITSNDCILEKSNVIFLMREQLTEILNIIGDGRTNNPLTRILQEKRTQEYPHITLIYDECHQLGAKGLQKAWRKWVKRLKNNNMLTSFRTIGLSATPIPSDQNSLPLLRNEIFPIQSTNSGCRKEWGVHVFHDVSTRQLLEHEILCPIDLHLQNTGDFQIPQKLLSRIAQTVEAPPKLNDPDRGPNSKEYLELSKFAKAFDRAVMGNEEVLEHLSNVIAKHFKTMGKTLIFAPDISSAERLIVKLANRAEIGRGRVSVVHSRLGELPFEQVKVLNSNVSFDPTNPAQTIAKFRSLGNEHAILVNVGMLTTGFDDPKIKTIIIARTTFSANLFWQMIGRGTRGIAVGGTDRCYVIDPVRLTELYGFMRGYVPTVENVSELLDQEQKDGIVDANHASCLKTVDVIPSVSCLIGSIEIDKTLENIRPDAAKAVIAFLRGENMTMEQYMLVLQNCTVTCINSGKFSVELLQNIRLPSLSLIYEVIARCERLLGCDLSWLRSIRYLPATTSEIEVKNFILKCIRVVENSLKTEDEWRNYELSRL